jgi:NAD(P)-dependent dehydrogenase (short-subunit alcohol dehydrogenase family)
MKAQKVWLVTGAARGFGLEIVKAALNRGDKVAATIRNPSVALSDIAVKNENLCIVQMDVTTEDQVKAAVDIVIKQYGQIDVLVNNAGYGIVGAIEEIADAEVRRQYDTNVFGLLNVTRAVLPFMREKKEGYIINISSLYAFDVIPGWALYGSTKFAVDGISKGLAKELEPFGIKVTAVEPGLFSTDFLSKDSFVTAQVPIAAYDDTFAGQMRAGSGSFHGQQPGDPAKLAEIIIGLANLDNPPLHLPIGPDAIENYILNAANMTKIIDEWRDISSETNRE